MTDELPENVRELHPPVHDFGNIPMRRIGKYPGGPEVLHVGPSPFDLPQARGHARVLMRQMWLTVGCAVVAADSELKNGIVAIATHPSIADAIAHAHNVSLQEGWAPL